MFVCLPGKQVPEDFTHKAKGNSITISPGIISASSRFKACLLLAPTKQVSSSTQVVCRLRSKGVVINELDHSTTLSWSPIWFGCREILTEHLIVFSGDLFKEHRCVEVDASEIQFEFSYNLYYFKNIVTDDKNIECGVQMLAEEGESSSKEHSDGAVEVSKEESSVETSWWVFSFFLFFWAKRLVGLA
ncbi:unnamed protein product [Microthlaspi erraticum]|uniref:Uncharacterized protein n=1 Tax=Microthlaspi erraticum TaxID=1685480 RepID=A0A6D2JSY4_9BRAS|nr:unnamed protein product [Microthlaspi erraticum]